MRVPGVLEGFLGYGEGSLGSWGGGPSYIGGWGGSLRNGGGAGLGGTGGVQRVLGGAWGIPRECQVGPSGWGGLGCRGFGGGVVVLGCPPL